MIKVNATLQNIIRIPTITRSILHIIICIPFFFPSLLFSQNLTVISPNAGDTLFVGDTVAIHYEYDQAFSESYSGVVIMISPDGGRGWFYLPPIEAPSGMIPLYEDWAKKPHVVIPDTLIDGESKAYLVSSNVKLKIKAYGSAFNGQTECCFSIMEKVNVSCVVPYNENNNDPKPFPVEKETGTGCGNGVGLSLLLPLLLTIPGKKSIQQNILHKKRK